MKQNPVNQIEVKANPALESQLIQIFSNKDAPEVIIETGTYLGTGTTQILIDAVVKTHKENSILFYTIESSQEWFKQASKNLSKYPWVQLFHGLSINKDECIQWIESDPYLLEHEKYPDLFVDDTTDPVKYYKSEFRPDMLGYIMDDNMLKSLTENFSTENIFFCLDSCGGTGYLEFQTVNSLMGDRGYYLFMDDAIDHVKHIRSAEVIRANEDGRWVVEYIDDRVMVAKKLPA